MFGQNLQLLLLQRPCQPEVPKNQGFTKGETAAHEREFAIRERPFSAEP
jgi:hypothetical protein